MYEQTICTQPFLTAVQLIFYVLKKIYAFVLKCKSVYTVLLCVMLWENLFVVVDISPPPLPLWMCREQSVVGLRRTTSALYRLSEDWFRVCELCRHRSNPYMNKYTRPFLKCWVSPLFWPLIWRVSNESGAVKTLYVTFNDEIYMVSLSFWCQHRSSCLSRRAEHQDEASRTRFKKI